MSKYKRLRLVLGLTQKDFSLQVGISQASVCKYENGSRRPGLSSSIKMQKLADDNKVKFDAFSF